MEYCVVYLSSSAGLLSETELVNIMQKSRQNNQALGVTGILLYCNGSIIQVLEGIKENVLELYHAIAQDQRHYQVTSLYADPIEKRSFAEWDMGYKTLDIKEMEHLKERMPFIENPAAPVKDKHDLIMSLVHTFYRNNHRN